MARHNVQTSPQFRHIQSGMLSSFYECRRCLDKFSVDPEINEGWEINHQCNLYRWAKAQAIRKKKLVNLARFYGMGNYRVVEMVNQRVRWIQTGEPRYFPFRSPDNRLE